MIFIMSESPPNTNLPVRTVSELSLDLKRTVEEGFALVRVKGELSGFKRHSSGHLYFALKDADAVLDGVCWRGSASKLAVKPEDGLEVICTGRLTTYPGRSKYQIVVESMEMSGEGALLKLLEERKRKLAAEGLFDPARKKPLPYLPEVIGVITSPTGAVIRDILHRLEDRFPRRVLLWPVAVQGEGSAEQVATAIAGFNRMKAGGAVPKPDVLIVARGGGSIEDLWAFNEEIVVRAAAASEIPLVSAVGHETDTTLIDYAADVRAPTPTAAAELVVPVRRDLIADLRRSRDRLEDSMERAIDLRAERLRALARGLTDPRRLIEEKAQRLDDFGERLGNGITSLLERRKAEVTGLSARLLHPREKLAKAQHQLEQLTGKLNHLWDGQLAERENRLLRLAGLLESYSYEGVLERGFALVRDAEGHVVGPQSPALPGTPWQVSFAGGHDVAVTVSGTAAAPSQKIRGKSDIRQGSLL